ncbi:MAG: amidohydrolase family protein [Rectinemataceae bacterium]
MAGDEFYDIHFHALSMSHPSLLSYLQTLRSRRLESIYSQVSSYDYLAKAMFRKGGERVQNLLAVMENEPGDTFLLMEDDLAGLYATSGDALPLLSEGLLEVGGSSYGKLVAVPLIMDFSRPGPYKPDTYYNRLPQKPVEAQILDVLAGVKYYRRKRPGGFLELHPFLGIDPANYSAASLAALLDKWFCGFVPGRRAGASVFSRMKRYDLDGPSRAWSPFAGVKLYPPLGFDPWPTDPLEREKVEYLYAFCEKRRIPIVTHCDDQGFRVISLEESWKRTSPRHYRSVLKRYPELWLDFAHLGQQYTSVRFRTPRSSWRDEIFSLMVEYPNVYADFSFNGVEASYYVQLVEALARLPAATRDIAETRIMFGSDFMINLAKVRSYADYFRIFGASPLSAEQKRRYASENPRRFLFGE